jgi:hypothetical protein
MNLFSPQEARKTRQIEVKAAAPTSCHGGRMLKK